MPSRSCGSQRPFDSNEVQQVFRAAGEDEAAIVNNREIPDICLQHMVAVSDGQDGFRSVRRMTKARLKDPATAFRETRKGEINSDEQLERLMPLRVGLWRCN